MTIQDDAALLRRAANNYRDEAQITPECNDAGIMRKHWLLTQASALESLATRLEGCVPDKSPVYGSSIAMAVATGWNDCRAEFLRRLEGEK